MSGSNDDDHAPHEAQPPPWWAELQRDMGRLLCTPLDAGSGQFRAPVASYPRALVAQVRDDAPGVIARLALYHEQYWKRLFSTLQTSFPRTAAVMGYFRFNGVVAAYLRRNPPRTFDLSDVGERFFPELSAALDTLAAGHPKTTGYRLIEKPLRVLSGSAASAPLDGALGSVDAPWSLVAQALHLDEAERRAFRAPREPIWDPSPEERARLRDARLHYATSFSLLRLDYDLPTGPVEGMDGHVPRRKTPKHVALARAPRGITAQIVDPIFARLLSRARLGSLGEAITQTESALAGSLRDHLHHSLDEYIHVALTSGFWVGAAWKPLGAGPVSA